MISDGRIDTDEAKDLVKNFDLVSQVTQSAIKEVATDMLNQGWQSTSLESYTSFRQLLKKS
ncbi:MAG: hypothetical protein H6767_05290 [Candidatus Peribacteria bacterium]|nr:MAG: hypothetical protein H6767_05290 [Candidatus Peribacteria bacterium]